MIVPPPQVRSIAMAWMNMLIELPGLVTPFISASILATRIDWLYPLVWGGVFLLQFFVGFAFKSETAGQALQDFR